MAPSTGHVVQRHGVKLLKGNLHPLRSGNEIFLHASAFKATADPHIIHVKRAFWRHGIIPKRIIEKTRLNEITAAPGYYRRALGGLKIDAELDSGMTPV